ncbi:MAG: PqqD family protein [Bacteroidales bacterium]|nr:PqqD family protein [Bacteroidales bacterium]
MDIQIKPSLQISDQGTLFDPETGDTFTLNESGLILIKMLYEGKDPETIFLSLSQSFNLTRELFDRIVIDFKSMLKSFNLLINE